MLRVFSWGYCGWGTKAADFVRLLDGAEKKAGFNPPWFVDVRNIRGGRAPDFVGHTFEEIAGKERYKHLKELGNARVEKSKRDLPLPKDIRNDPDAYLLNDPSAVGLLLDEAKRAEKEHRRVLYFCACEFPHFCHRRYVGKLLLEYAKSIGEQLEVIEWPGGSPEIYSRTINVELFRKIRGGRKSLDIQGQLEDVPKTLPWGSIIELKSAGQTMPVAVRPARLAKNWYFPIWSDVHDPEIGFSLERLQALVSEFRKEEKFEPRYSATEPFRAARPSQFAKAAKGAAMASNAKPVVKGNAKKGPKLQVADRSKLIVKKYLSDDEVHHNAAVKAHDTRRRMAAAAKKGAKPSA